MCSFILQPSSKARNSLSFFRLQKLAPFKAPFRQRFCLVDQVNYHTLFNLLTKMLVLQISVTVSFLHEKKKKKIPTQFLSNQTQRTSSQFFVQYSSLNPSVIDIPFSLRSDCITFFFRCCCILHLKIGLRFAYFIFVN